jgi:hypothetical protein
MRSALGYSRNEPPWNGRFVSLLPLEGLAGAARLRRERGAPGGLRAALRQREPAAPFRVHGAGRRPLVGRGGAVYMLQAIKRVRGMRLLTPAWQEQKDAREKQLAAAKRQGVSH